MKQQSLRYGLPLILIVGLAVSACKKDSDPAPTTPAPAPVVNTATPVFTSTPTASSTSTSTATPTPTRTSTPCSNVGAFGQAVTSLMGNIGYTYTCASDFALAHNASVTAISFYSAAGKTMRVGIYSAGVTMPSTKVFSSDVVTTVDGLNVATFAPVTLAPGTYYLAARFLTGSGNNFGINTTYDGLWLGIGDFPDTWSQAAYYTLNQMAIQAHYIYCP